MKKILLLLLVPMLAFAGRLQDVDFMTEAQLITAGATKTSLLNDTKIYVTEIAKTLDQAIADGDIGGGEDGTNVLINPRFKDEGEGWTITGGCVASYPVTTELEKTLRLTCTAATFSVKQTSTLLVPFAKQQAAFDLQVKSDTNGVKVASINNSIRNTEYSVVGDDEFKRFKQIGVIADAVNNGLEIYSDVAFTGVVDIDNAYLGLSNLTQEVSGAHFVGKIDLSNNCRYIRVPTGISKMLDGDVCSATSITGELSLPTNSLEAGLKVLNPRLDGYYSVAYNGLLYKPSNSGYCIFSLSKTSAREDSGDILLNSSASSTSEGQINANIRFESGDSGEVFLLGNATSPSCEMYGESGNPSAWSVHFFPDDKHTIVNQTNEFNPAYLWVELSGNQTISSTAPTRVEFDNVREDNSESYDATTNHRYTIKTDGKYTVSVSTQLGSTGVSELFSQRVYLNGAPTDGMQVDDSGGATSRLLSQTQTLSLSEGDYLEVWVDSTSDASYTVNAVTYRTRLTIMEEITKATVTGNFEQIETVTGDLTAETVNSFKASVFNTNGAITNYDGFDLLSGSCTYDGTKWSCPITSNLFTLNPKCWANAVAEVSGNNFCKVIATTTTNADIQCRQTAIGANSQEGFDLFCEKRDADVNKQFSGAVINAADSTELIANTVLENITSDDLVLVEAQGANSEPMTSLVTPVVFNEISDVQNTWDGSTFTAPKDGVYSMEGANYLATPYVFTYSYIDTGSGFVIKHLAGVKSSNVYGKFQDTIKLNAGDKWQLRVEASGNLGGFNNGNHYITITQQATKQSIVQSLVGEMATSCQTKYLSGAVSTTGTIADLTFNNIDVAKKYSYSLKLINAQTDGAENDKYILLDSSDSEIIGDYARSHSAATRFAQDMHSPFFSPDSSVLTVNVTAILGMSITSGSATLCELPDTVIETTKFD